MELIQRTPTLWEIPKHGGMRVPGRIYASAPMMERIRTDQSLQQVVNVAHLPGIVRYSLAMPDIHWGYGFPIGGVCATRVDDGVISPGGVGYDINCGVRFVATALDADEVAPRISSLVAALFRAVPTGVGASRAIGTLSRGDLRRVCERGAGWAVAEGWGRERDLDVIEEGGCLDGADPDAVGERPWERGASQLGTLGSGNHFLEIGRVDEIHHREAAAAFGLRLNAVVVLIHCGSRGFGYQICDEALPVAQRAARRHGIPLPDPQLACAPVRSAEGRAYLGAMRCAANYAFANRQIIMALAERAFCEALGLPPERVGFSLVTDICHNIAKIETHDVDGTPTRVCVHRKGATRAFGPGSPALPAAYRHLGQPVPIPGDMGRYSYLCLGTDTAMRDTFGSSCHGAGRHMSRHQAMRHGAGRDLIGELRKRGVEIRATGVRTIAEEMPEAYKDVADVVGVMHDAGISLRVARVRPMGVIKG